MAPDRLSRELAEQLEAARMTAEQLSRRARLARDTVGRWIRDSNTVPTLASLQMVERVLKSQLGQAVDMSAAVKERRARRGNVGTGRLSIGVVNTRVKYFDAGTLAGQIAGAKQIAPQDLRRSSLERELRDSLIELGVIAQNETLPADEELDERIDRSGRIESACFKFSAGFLILQMHLHITSLGKDGLPPDALQASIDSVRPLVRQLSVTSALIDAPEASAAFIVHVAQALADVNQWRSRSTDLFAESEVVKVMVRSHLSGLPGQYL